MLLDEFLVVIIAVIIALISTVLMWYYTRNIPPLIESRLLVIGISLTCLQFIGFLLSAYFHTPNKVNDLGVATHRFGFLVGMIGIAFWVGAFILPNLKFNYRSISLLVSMVVLNISCGLINFFTITHEIKNHTIIIEFDPIGLITLIFSIMLFIKLFRDRIQQIISISSNSSESPFINIKARIIFSVIILSTLSTLLIVIINPDIGLPGYSWILPYSLIFLYFSYAFSKDRGFWFITPAKLYAVIITDKKSGTEVYIKRFTEEIKDEFFGPLLKSIDIIIRDVLHSSEQLKQISYHDKAVLIIEEKNIVLFCILSENNLISQSIAQYLAKDFENRFSDFIPIKKSRVINMDDFMEFEAVIDTIRPFIPL
ncbi:MAG: hypothetical protein ACXAC7_01905 [Candidatus Hodarchaeales archaeon]